MSSSTKDMEDQKFDKAVLAGNITRLMRLSRISQKALARIMEKSTRQIRRWEDPNDSAWPKAQELPKLALSLQCSIDDLFSFDSNWLPKDESEREILRIVRQSSSNLPVHLIAHAVTTLMLKMDRQERENWIENGNLIVRRK